MICWCCGLAVDESNCVRDPAQPDKGCAACGGETTSTGLHQDLLQSLRVVYNALSVVSADIPSLEPAHDHVATALSLLEGVMPVVHIKTPAEIRPELERLADWALGVVGQHRGCHTVLGMRSAALTAAAGVSIKATPEQTGALVAEFQEHMLCRLDEGN